MWQQFSRRNYCSYYSRIIDQKRCNKPYSSSNSTNFTDMLKNAKFGYFLVNKLIFHGKSGLYLTIFILVNWFPRLNGYVIFIIWSEESFSRNVLKYLSKWKNSLVFKLHQNEILTILLNLQINILVHRQQRIDLDEGYLFWAINTAGVSQRSIFGSFLFLAYTKNFFDNVQ